MCRNSLVLAVGLASEWIDSAFDVGGGDCVGVGYVGVAASQIHDLDVVTVVTTVVLSRQGVSDLSLTVV